MCDKLAALVRPRRKSSLPAWIVIHTEAFTKLGPDARRHGRKLPDYPVFTNTQQSLGALDLQL